LTFDHSGWINVSPIGGPNNKFPLCLNEATLFPIPSSIVQTVYSSDCLEHLDDKTLAQTLREARRVMVDGGDLVIKAPQFRARLKRSAEEVNYQSLIALLEGAGFVVRSTEADEVCARFSDIPEIAAMKETSFYCHAIPV
jgi:predicted SAM-dependent methyltransferase